MAGYIFRSIKCMHMVNVMKAVQSTQRLSARSLVSTKTVRADSGHETGDFIRDSNMHVNTEQDKVMLVKAGIYKVASEVPDQVPIAQIRKAKDFMRVRINLWMLGATLGGCIAMIFYGRKLRSAGDTLEKREAARLDVLRKSG